MKLFLATLHDSKVIFTEDPTPEDLMAHFGEDLDFDQVIVTATKVKNNTGTEIVIKPKKGVRYGSPSPQR